MDTRQGKVMLRQSAVQQRSLGIAVFPSAVPVGAGELVPNVSPSIGASYVVLSTTDLLTNERVLTGTARISIADAGPNSTVTIDAVGAALTRVNDTNVTLTLGGAPTTALVNAASLTLGWVGQLAASRGGTGIGSYTIGDMLFASGATTLSVLTSVAGGSVLISGGVGVAPAWSTTPTVTEYRVSGTKVVGAQGAAVADASGGATIDAEARTAINTLLSRLRAHGLIAT